LRPLKASIAKALRGILLAGGFGLASLAFAQTGIGIAPPRYELVLDRGATTTGQFALFTQNIKTQRIHVAKVDWLVKPDGALFSLPAGSGPYSASPWLSVATDPFVLSKAGSVDTRFSVHLPQDSSLEGSYWTAVAFTTEPTATGRTGLAARFQTRLLAIVYVTVRGTERPAAALQGFSVVNEDGKRYLLADVVNLGNVYLRFKGELRFVDVAGKIVRREELRERVLLRDGLMRYRLPFPKDLPTDAVLVQIELQPQGPAGSYGGPPLYGEVPLQ